LEVRRQLCAGTSPTGAARAAYLSQTKAGGEYHNEGGKYAAQATATAALVASAKSGDTRPCDEGSGNEGFGHFS